MTQDEFRANQSSHANELKTIRTIQKTFGGSRSQIRNLLRLQQAQRTQIKDPNAGNQAAPLFQDPPRIRRSEVITQEIRHIGQVTPSDLLIVPPGVVPGGTSGIEEVPDDNVYYVRSRAPSDPVGAWTRGVEDVGIDAKIWARSDEVWYEITDKLVLSSDAEATSTIYTNPPSATVTLSPVGNLHFAFVIPDGAPGPAGMDGSDPTDEHLNDLIVALFDPADYAFNPVSVGTLTMTVSNPPTQVEVQAIADKVDELINALKH